MCTGIHTCLYILIVYSITTHTNKQTLILAGLKWLQWIIIEALEKLTLDSKCLCVCAWVCEIVFILYQSHMCVISSGNGTTTLNQLETSVFDNPDIISRST